MLKTGVQECGTPLPYERTARKAYCNVRCANAKYNRASNHRISEALAAERARLRCLTCAKPITDGKRMTK